MGGNGNSMGVGREWEQESQSRTPLSHSEIDTVRQNTIQRTVRTADLSALMTVHSFSTQYNAEQC